MNKNNLIMYGILGVAAYWAYNRFAGSVDSFIDDMTTPELPSSPGEPSKTPISSNGVTKPALVQGGMITNTNPRAVKPVGVPDVTTPNNLNAVPKPVNNDRVPPVSAKPPASATDYPFAARMQQLNGGSNVATADVWNAYYSQLSGVQQTADLFEPGNRDGLISLGTYFARRNSAGLSGGLVRSGVGGIFDRSIALRSYTTYNRGAY